MQSARRNGLIVIIAQLRTIKNADNIIVLLIVGSLCFKYTPSYRIDAKIKMSSSNTSVLLYIPPSIRNKITIDSRVVVDLEVKDGKLFATIHTIEKELTITNNGTFYIATALLTEDAERQINNFKSDDYVNVKANVFFEKTSIFKQVTDIIFY
jgi:hypothetical protein